MNNSKSVGKVANIVFVWKYITEQHIQIFCSILEG